MRPIEGEHPYVYSTMKLAPTDPIQAEHACKMGLEDLVSKWKDSAYRSGRSPDWLKMKYSDTPAMKREAEEEWGKKKWR